MPVFLYGELAGPGRDARGAAPRRRCRAWRERMAGEDGRRALRPDFGPRGCIPSAGATLVAAREPLVAFNLQLAPPADARRTRARSRR